MAERKKQEKMQPEAIEEETTDTNELTDTSAKPAILLTFPSSHYCEKARWALDYAGANYVEEPHFPAFHMIFKPR